jgi:hypothetical protein
MRSRNMRALAIASAMLMAPAGFGPAVGQPQGRPVRGEAALVQLPITIPCCRCIDGSQRSVGINSGSGAGTVPWRVSGPGVASGATGQTITSGVNPQWTANLAPAQWIQPNSSSGTTSHPGGVYNYTITIQVPRCIIPMSVIVSGQAAGDDQIRIFYGNNQIGQTVLAASPSPAPPVAAGGGGWGFRNERVASFSQALGSGTHTIRIEVTNGSAGPHGLLVRGSIRSRCAREPERRLPGNREEVPDQPDAEVRTEG